MYMCVQCCMICVYTHDAQCHGVASLVLLLQAALCSQGLAAGRNEVHPVFEVLGKLWALNLLFADIFDDYLGAAVHYVLPTEHDRRDKAIFLGHKTLLQVKGFLIPAQNFGPNLKSLTEGQGAAVPDGGGPYHQFCPQFAWGHEQPISHVMVEACKVTLPQIPRVVHVAQVVQIVWKDHAVDTLLG